MDERERDKFYSSSAPPGDDDEYELEPADPEVVAAEERRAQEAIEATRRAIDLDEIYRDVEHDRGREILENWVRDFRFRFQVKHLLIATAVLAILLTLYRMEMLGVVVVVGIMLSVAGLYLYLQWEEKKRQGEADRRRQEMYALRRAGMQRDVASTGPATSAVAARPPAPPPELPNETDELWTKSSAEREFHFRFSLQQLIIAITAAAFVFGLAHLLGGPSNAAMLLGLVALVGLVIHAAGFDPPQIVILGWWLTLVMYVVMSIAGVVWTAGS